VGEIDGTSLALEEPSLVDEACDTVHNEDLLNVVLVYQAFIGQLQLLVGGDVPLARFRPVEELAEAAQAWQHYLVQ